MSAYAPPTYSVTPFNPAYFATSSGGISLATASGLFLNKTSADTATALETFNSGIATNSINPTSSTSAMTISSSSNTGSITIDTGITGSTNASPAIAIGTSNVAKVIKIGSGNANNSMHIGSLDIAGTSINNITGASGAIVIGDSQTTGTLAIGDGSTRTGAVTIGSLSTSTVPITIGNTAAASTTTIRNPIMSYSYTTIPTYVSGQIGFKTIAIFNTVGGNALTLNTLATALTTASCPIGIYLVEYTIRLAATGAASCNLTAFMSSIQSQGTTPSTQPLLYGQFGIGTTTITLPAYAAGDDNYFACNGSAIINQTTAGSFSLVYKAQASAGVSFFNLGVANNPVRAMTYLCATRIA